MDQFADVPKYVKEFLIYMGTIKGSSKNTVHEYYLDIKLFLRFMKSFRESIPFSDEIDVSGLQIEFIQKIDLSDLYEYLYFLDTVKKNNANTRARKVSSIRSFFKYLNVKAKLLDTNPALELDAPKIKKSLPRYLEFDQSLQLLNAIDGENKERDYAIVFLFLNCGMRLSELVNINIQDIQRDKLVITGKGNKERTVYLSDACREAIADYLKVRPRDGVKDRDALFLSNRRQRISNKTVQYLVKKYLATAGLDTAKYSTHKLRHTAATLMYQEGDVDIRLLQEILGHTNLSTTEIYTHVNDSQLKDAVNQNPLAKVKKKRSDVK